RDAVCGGGCTEVECGRGSVVEGAAGGERGDRCCADGGLSEAWRYGGCRVRSANGFACGGRESAGVNSGGGGRGVCRHGGGEDDGDSSFPGGGNVATGDSVGGEVSAEVDAGGY